MAGCHVTYQYNQLYMGCYAYELADYTSTRGGRGIKEISLSVM